MIAQLLCRYVPRSDDQEEQDEQENKSQCEYQPMTEKENYATQTLSNENEKAEKIEAIRFLESGRKIKMVETKISSIGIDTQQDIEKARALWALT